MYVRSSNYVSFQRSVFIQPSEKLIFPFYVICLFQVSLKHPLKTLFNQTICIHDKVVYFVAFS